MAADERIRFGWATAIADVVRDPTILIDTATGCLDTVRSTLIQARAGTESLLRDARDLARDPARLAAGVSSIAHQIGEAVTDLERVKGFLAELSGLTDFQLSWDQDVPLLERIQSVGRGTLKIGLGLEADDSGGSLEAARRFSDGRFVEYDLQKGLVRDVAKIAGEEDRYNRGTLRFWVPNSEALDPTQITALLNRGDAAHRGLDLGSITRKVLDHENLRRGLNVP